MGLHETGTFVSPLIEIHMKTVMYRKRRTDELLMVYKLTLSSRVGVHIFIAFPDSFSTKQTHGELWKEIMMKSNQHKRI